MRVEILFPPTGLRDGQPWPVAGSVLDLPNDEAAAMVRAGQVKPASAPVAPVTETTTAVPEGETTDAAPVAPVKRGPGRPRKAKD